MMFSFQLKADHITAVQSEEKYLTKNAIEYKELSKLI